MARVHTFVLLMVIAFLYSGSQSIIASSQEDQAELKEQSSNNDQPRNIPDNLPIVPSRTIHSINDCDGIWLEAKSYYYCDYGDFVLSFHYMGIEKRSARYYIAVWNTGRDRIDFHPHKSRSFFLNP